MKAVSIIVLTLLTLLAVASGTAKILLLQQEVDFFGKYGVSDLVLIVFGSVQLLGGLLLITASTRFVGAAVVAATFLVSLVMLLMDGNIPASIATAVATLLLAAVMKQNWKPNAN